MLPYPDTSFRLETTDYPDPDYVEKLINGEIAAYRIRYGLPEDLFSPYRRLFESVFIVNRCEFKWHDFAPNHGEPFLWLRSSLGIDVFGGQSRSITTRVQNPHVGPFLANEDNQGYHTDKDFPRYGLVYVFQAALRGGVTEILNSAEESEVNECTPRIGIKLQANNLLVFDSHLVHRATEVTAGQRSLVLDEFEAEDVLGHENKALLAG